MNEHKLKIESVKITLKRLKRLGFCQPNKNKSAYIDLGESGFRLHYFPKDKIKFKLWGNMYDAGNVYLPTMVEVEIFISAFINDKK